jgi:hypothetical protein
MMKNRHLLWFCLLSCLPFLAWSQSAFYVSPSGDDSDPGSFASPWRTVQHGVDQLGTNDTLYLMNGNYHEKIHITTNAINLYNYPGHTPVIDALGLTQQNGIIEIHDASYVSIVGLALQNNVMPDAQGILVEGTSQFTKIHNCTIHDIHFSANPNAVVDSSTNAQGIIVYGTDSAVAIREIEIKGNHVYNCRLGYSEGIAVNGNVDGFRIVGNHVHDLTNIGIDCIGHEGTCPDPLRDRARNGDVLGNTVHHCVSFYAPSAGIYVDGGSHIILQRNICYNNGYGIEVGCESIGDSTHDILVTSNLLYNNEVSAIAFGGFDYPAGSGKVTHSTMMGNTCFNNGWATQTYGELYLSYCENSEIHSNIFDAVGTNILVRAENSQPGLLFDYNLVYGPGGAGSLLCLWNGTTASGFPAFVASSQTNTNSQFVDPGFVSRLPGSLDLHLTQNSPAIDGGSPNFPPSLIWLGDIDGDPRLMGNAILDCGADEYPSGGGLGIPDQPVGLVLSPNPGTDYVRLSHLSTGSTVTLYNTLGSVVYTAPVQEGETIDLTALPRGIYLVTAKSDEGVTRTTKLVKE